MVDKGMGSGVGLGLSAKTATHQLYARGMSLGLFCFGFSIIVPSSQGGREDSRAHKAL